jgi:hypothetical protein
LEELQQLQEKHSCQAAGINTHADEAFQNSYKVRWKSIETSLAPQVLINEHWYLYLLLLYVVAGLPADWWNSSEVGARRAEQRRDWVAAGDADGCPDEWVQGEPPLRIKQRA